MSRSAPASPYIGLVPYSADTADYFFGRERDRDLVTSYLIASRLTLVYGASGVGKTSLLLAGVVPWFQRLAAESLADSGSVEFAVVYFRGWRDDPVAGLIDAVARSLAAAVGEDGDGPHRPASSLPEVLEAAADRLGGTVLLVLDQFEEYLLHRPSGEGDGSLDEALTRVHNHPDLPVHILIALREDALAQLDRLAGRIPRLFQDRVHLERLDRESARQAITGPLERFNAAHPQDEPVTIEEALADAVLDQISTGDVRPGQEERPFPGGAARDASPQAIEPALLQLVMSRLWSAEMAAGSRRLGLEALHRLGDAERIVQGYLHNVMSRLTPAQRRVAESLLGYLVTPDGTRRALDADSLAELSHQPADQVREVLQTLVAARILRAEAVRSLILYELSHDVLAAAVRDYERARKSAEQRRRYLRLAASLIVVLAIMGLVALVSVLGWLRAAEQRRNADDQRRKAEAASAVAVEERQKAEAAGAVAIKERDYSRSLELAAHARLESASDPELGLLLATEAVKGPPSAQSETPAEAEAIFRQVIPESRIRAILEDRTGETPDPTSSKEILGASFSRDPEGTYVVTVARDNRVRIWNATTHQLEMIRPGSPSGWMSASFLPNSDKDVLLLDYEGRILIWTWTRDIAVELNQQPGKAAACSPDGRYVVVADASGVARVWGIEARRVVRELPAMKGETRFPAVSPGGRLVALLGRDDKVVIWDTAKGNVADEFEGLGRAEDSTAMRFSPNSQYLLIDRWRAPARLRDIARHKSIELPGSGATTPGSVYGDLEASRSPSMAFSPDGQVVAAVGEDGVPRVWSVKTGQTGEILAAELRKELREHRGAARDVEFSPDGRTFATTGDDGTVCLWDTGSWGLIAVLRGHLARVECAAFSPDGRSVVTGDSLGQVRVWQYDAPIVLPGSAAAIRPDGRQVITTSAGNDTPQVFDTHTGDPVLPLVGHQGTISQAVFSPDGRRAATLGVAGDIHLWDTANWNNPLPVIQGDSEHNLQAAFSPNGQYITAVGLSRTADIWVVSEPKRPPLGISHNFTINALAFSPDSRSVVTASADNTARVWRIDATEPVRLLSHDTSVISASFDPKGRLVITGCDDNTVQVWDVATAPRRLWNGVSKIKPKFSPDGRFVLTVDSDDAASIRDASTGQRAQTFRGHKGEVREASFSQDGLRVLTAGRDGTARVWDVAMARSLVVYPAVGGDVRSASFARDDTLVVTVSADDQVRIYHCDATRSVDDLLKLAKDRVTRELTKRERQRFGLAD
jgi:WD40 repeat protein